MKTANEILMEQEKRVQELAEQISIYKKALAEKKAQAEEMERKNDSYVTNTLHTSDDEKANRVLEKFKELNPKIVL